MSSDRNPRESAAQQVFGPQAGVYASSPVHVDDPSLDVVRQMASQPLAGDGRYEWALDMGTGAGFTAFAMAEFSRRVAGNGQSLMVRGPVAGSAKPGL